MKTIKSIVAILLAITLLASSAFCVFGVDENDTKKGFTLEHMVYGGDFDTITTDQFIKVVRTLRMFRNVVTGNVFKGDDGVFDVTLDDDITELCRYMAENSCFDPEAVLTEVPDVFEPGVVVAKTFKFDTTAFREEMHQTERDLRKEGKATLGVLARFIGTYFSGIESAYIHLIPTGEENVYAIKCQLTYSDGQTEDLRTDMFVNLETGEFYGVDGKGAGNIGFNSSVYELMVYAPMYCWMREFGFCVEYDILCFFLPMYRYSTRRFKFDYQGKEWMIQAWKGNYLITSGGEVGVYNRDSDKFGSYYDTITDDERMPMSLQIIHDDEVLVNIEETNHWWVNGFRIGYKLYSPANLTLKSTITMYDEEMVKAFTESIDNNIYEDVTYSVDGLTVSICW